MTTKLNDDQWHLDKKVPVTILIALSMNTIAGVWWASKVESRIERVEMLVLEQRTKDAQQDQVIVENRNERNARLDRIENKLDSLIVRISERAAR